MLGTNVSTEALGGGLLLQALQTTRVLEYSVGPIT